jgi:hypothetical protein
MSILSSIAGNKTILKVALNQITGSMEKDGISAIVIVRNPNNNDEESHGIDAKVYKERIGILEGADLTRYMNDRSLIEQGAMLISGPEYELFQELLAGKKYVLSGDEYTEWVNYKARKEAGGHV